MSTTRTTLENGSEINQQSDPSSINSSTNASIENNQKEFTDHQQVDEINTNITLTEFRRCYIPLERCKVGDCVINYNDVQSATSQKGALLSQEEGNEAAEELQQKSQSYEFVASKTESHDEK